MSSEAHTVTCRFCKASFQLNPDTPETRQLRTDPLQQIKAHIQDCPEFSVLTVGMNAGLLMNMLCFTSSLPGRYRESMISVLDWLHAGAIEGTLRTLCEDASEGERGKESSIQPIAEESPKPKSSHRKRHV